VSQRPRRALQQQASSSKQMNVRKVTLALLSGLAGAQNACGTAGVNCGEAEALQTGIAQQWSGFGTPVKLGTWSRPQRCPPETDFGRLEDLLPQKHFRGPLSGPASYFKRVPPHYLGHHANFSKCERSVYIDVGAREFDSKEGMLSTFAVYPQLLGFDEFYAFEAASGFYKLPPQPDLVRRLQRQGMSAARAASFARRHFFLQAFIGARSNPSTTPPTLGFSDLLKTMLGLQPADAVVVKMDVEGYEYDIVRTLLADGTHALIDEILLEVHYGHPAMMRRFNWCRMPKPGWQFWCSYSLQNATAMYRALRDAGVYAHHWP